MSWEISVDETPSKRGNHSTCVPLCSKWSIKGTWAGSRINASISYLEIMLSMIIVAELIQYLLFSHESSRRKGTMSSMNLILERIAHLSSKGRDSCLPLVHMIAFEQGHTTWRTELGYSDLICRKRLICPRWSGSHVPSASRREFISLRKISRKVIKTILDATTARVSAEKRLWWKTYYSDSGPSGHVYINIARELHRFYQFSLLSK